jgi:hypothetical protein
MADLFHDVRGDVPEALRAFAGDGLDRARILHLVGPAAVTVKTEGQFFLRKFAAYSIGFDVADDFDESDYGANRDKVWRVVAMSRQSFFEEWELANFLEAAWINYA